jgi:hypothetical protein
MCKDPRLIRSDPVVGLAVTGCAGNTFCTRPDRRVSVAYSSVNLYDTLGVRSDADAKQIKAAYLRLAKVTHPDHGGEQMAPLFLTVRHAYETLSDPVSRRNYDASLGNYNSPPAPPDNPEPAPEPPYNPPPKPAPTASPRTAPHAPYNPPPKPAPTASPRTAAHAPYNPPPTGPPRSEQKPKVGVRKRLDQIMQGLAGGFFVGCLVGLVLSIITSFAIGGLAGPLTAVICMSLGPVIGLIVALND